jgi:hypothetical protein
MMASSVVTGVLGLAATFFPKEILNITEIQPTETLILFVQITGALYFGFALMNWMAKAAVIGGIYARPLAIGNFAHFMIGAVTLIKAAMNHSASPHLWTITVIYSVFAILFGRLLFTSPRSESKF